jgi:predicted SnoaL-like aldol condensation-catalyzing enzyme
MRKTRPAFGAVTAAMLILALSGLPARAAGRASLTEANRPIITHFADLFYTEKKVGEAFAAYVAPDYVQHNPGIADGREAAVAALTPMFAKPDQVFKIEKILVDGDMAVIHLRVAATAIPRGASVVDMYRLKGGKVVEHWDVIQVVPASAANRHPMF